MKDREPKRFITKEGFKHAGQIALLGVTVTAGSIGFAKFGEQIDRRERAQLVEQCGGETLPNCIEIKREVCTGIFMPPVTCETRSDFVTVTPQTDPTEVPIYKVQ